jgi:hypothetical protein
MVSRFTSVTPPGGRTRGTAAGTRTARHCRTTSSATDGPMPTASADPTGTHRAPRKSHGSDDPSTRRYSRTRNHTCTPSDPAPASSCTTTDSYCGHDKAAAHPTDRDDSGPFPAQSGTRTHSNTTPVDSTWSEGAAARDADRA